MPEDDNELEDGGSGLVPTPTFGAPTPPEAEAQEQEDEWVSLREASIRLGVSISWLRKEYREKGLPTRDIPGPRGPQKAVPLRLVAARAARFTGANPPPPVSREPLEPLEPPARPPGPSPTGGYGAVVPVPPAESSSGGRIGELSALFDRLAETERRADVLDRLAEAERRAARAEAAVEQLLQRVAQLEDQLSRARKRKKRS